MNSDLLTRLRERPDTLGAFALLVRSEQGEENPILEILAGEVVEYQSLESVPLPPEEHVGLWVLGIVPYRQIYERGYECVDDGEPLRVMQIRETQRVELHSALHRWPEIEIKINEGHFDIDDSAYSDIVERIVKNEISNGEGSNFVIKRTYKACIDNYSVICALTAFKRLVQQERKAYWTFLVHSGDRTWIGASPERQVKLNAGIASMNPISGTYRYPKSGATLPGILEFLNDRKEADELYMVVDEELKMMSRFCPAGARVIGPRLKMMSRLAHTEYMLEGQSDADPRTILKETFFSPAVIGSPAQNACRVIARYEPDGRRYYAGVLALFGRSQDKSLSLDSTILIRTADIDCQGNMQVSVGATIVRHSNPLNEALETRAKACAIISSFSEPTLSDLTCEPSVTAALEQRNTGISKFWLADFHVRNRLDGRLAGREVLVIDAEDRFTEMLGHQLRALGLTVTITGTGNQRVRKGDWDLALFGPGPGDPCNHSDPRINQLRQALSHALAGHRPFLAVCLSHQLLCLEIKLPIIRLRSPNQGIQRQINYFGQPEKVGFYNTFCAQHPTNELLHDGQYIEVCRDPDKLEVHALRGSHFVSTQFHSESLLTEHGPELLHQSLLHIVGAKQTSRYLSRSLTE